MVQTGHSSSSCTLLAGVAPGFPGADKEILGMKIDSTSVTLEGVSPFLEGDSSTSVHVVLGGAMIWPLLFLIDLLQTGKAQPSRTLSCEI